MAQAAENVGLGEADAGFDGALSFGFPGRAGSMPTS